MPAFTAADTIRILIATDSHVGAHEKDPIRKDDSWKSFDEVMRLAKEQDVDMVLLAGDLFHDNKPSRKAMYQVMRSLRMNCLGEKPCELEFLSDANDVFDGAFNHVNYEDPDINVAIPVFSIHGNHDDPTGDGNYCSLDLLQTSGLLNYYGRTPEADRLEIKPVLLQKGQTKLALYGMSNVRDERLYHTFRDHNVKFFKPGVQQKDWFNIMAVHQNHHAYSETGYLPENFLPDFLDLVIWGHEHECLIDPTFNPSTTFAVMQPGSSVATSLVPGEAVPKHVAVVSVTGREYKVEKHRLKSVRPFVTREISLANEKKTKALAMVKDNKTKVTNELIKIVEELIDEAKAEWVSIQDDEEALEDIPLPLIRLRVEYTPPEGGKYELENPQRFSNRFVGRVANVTDAIQYYRKKAAGTRKNKNEVDMPEEATLASIGVDNVKVDKLVRAFLEQQSLKILPQTLFGDAVTQFVDKNDKDAMSNFVSDSLDSQVKQLLGREEEDEDLADAMDLIRLQQEAAFAAGTLKRNKGRGKLKPRPANWDSDEHGAWEDQPGVLTFPASVEEEVTPASAAKPRGRAKATTILSDDDDDASVISAPAAKKPAAKKAVPAKKAPTKNAPAKAPTKTTATRGRKKAPEPDPSDDEDDFEMIDAPPPRKTQPKRAAAPKGRQTQLTFSQQPKEKTQQASVEISDDEISDDAFEPVSQPTRRR